MPTSHTLSCAVPAPRKECTVLRKSTRFETHATVGGEHARQRAGAVVPERAPETCRIVLTNVASTRLL